MKLEPFEKKVQGDSSHLQCEDTVKTMSVRNDPTLDTDHNVTLILGFSDSRTGKSKYFAHKLHSLWYFNVHFNNNTMVLHHTNVLIISPKEQRRFLPINTSISFLYFYNDIVLVTD